MFASALGSFLRPQPRLRHTNGTARLLCYVDLKDLSPEHRLNGRTPPWRTICHRQAIAQDSEGGQFMSRFNRVRSVLLLLAVLAVLSWRQGSLLISKSAYGQRIEAIAKNVKRRAERLEKVEGKNDLVKDKVEVKTNANGERVIEQIGEASWYGKKFHGKKTATGETFNQYDLTAAHPTLPLGTIAIVTNLETGKSVKVEINDRGPYAKGRDIDLSKQAATAIGLTKDGAAPVKIEAEVPPEKKMPDQK